MKLRLFPFSLRGKALDWLERLPNHSIHTWDELAEKFIAKFFSPWHMATLRDEILAFKQEPNEPLNEIWERYRTVVKECPNNDMTENILQQTFYRGKVVVEDNTVKIIPDASNSTQSFIYCPNWYSQQPIQSFTITIGVTELVR